MDRTSPMTVSLASVVFHAFMIMGHLGILATAFRGITQSTVAAAFLLLLAGLITLVYPHVGTHPRFVLWTWGQPRRSGLPWLAMLALLAICVVYVSR